MLFYSDGFFDFTYITKWSSYVRSRWQSLRIAFTYNVVVVVGERKLLKADYQLILSLLCQDHSYREIEAMDHCSYLITDKARTAAGAHRCPGAT